MLFAYDHALLALADLVYVLLFVFYLGLEVAYLVVEVVHEPAELLFVLILELLGLLLYYLFDGRYQVLATMLHRLHFTVLLL